jgi:hypothetical protein
LELKNKEPTIITEKVFSALAEQSANESFSSKTEAPKGGIKIDERLIKSTLNGYEISHPFGKETAEAAFAVSKSFSLPKITEKVKDIIGSFFHVERIQFYSFALLAFLMLRKMYPREENFILMDVSGEQTEISIVKEGIIAETSTFPSGRNQIIRIIKKDTSIPPLSAQAFLRLYQEKGGAGAMIERVRKSLDLAKREWQRDFTRTLEELSDEMFFPRSIFIAADYDVLSFFTQAVAGEDFGRFMISPKAFRVTPINEELLAPLVRWSRAGEHDPFIGTVSSFAQVRHS